MDQGWLGCHGYTLASYRGKACRWIGYQIVIMQTFKHKNKITALLLWGFFMPELFAVVAGIFLELRHQCVLGNFRQKKGLRFYSKPLIYLAPPDGLEPPT